MFRDPKRLEIPVASWTGLSTQEKEPYFAEADREIDEVGIVVVARALPGDRCEELARLIEEEIRMACHIERVMHERRKGEIGYKIYNLQSRHPAFMELIAFPFLIEYFRRFLGPRMALHSSEGALIPPGAEGGGWHYDGHDRIPGYFLSMNAIYYLCDADVRNGATRYVPGTHKEFISVQEAKSREAKYVSVKKGDLVMFNPYLIHAGSANPSDANRPVIINYYQRGYIKQGFDFPRSMSVSEVKRLTKDQRTLLGFDHRVPLDVHELYMFRPPKVDDMDPIFPVKET